METILVVGATGNIGVSVIIAALRARYNVLAIVRNQASADKMFKHVGTKEGITTVEADVMSDDGVSSVVEKVRAGQLPAFQHVHASVGAWHPTTPIQNVDMASFRKTMHNNVETNFMAYKATVPYLIEKAHPNSTWTLCTGGAGESGTGGVTAVSQGALFSLANVASRENKDTNIRFNELYLNYRVDFDSVAEEQGGNRLKSSVFAKVYEKIFADKQLKGARVSVTSPEDVEKLRHEQKL